MVSRKCGKIINSTVLVILKLFALVGVCLMMAGGLSIFRVDPLEGYAEGLFNRLNWWGKTDVSSFYGVDNFSNFMDCAKLNTEILSQTDQVIIWNDEEVNVNLNNPPDEIGYVELDDERLGLTARCGASQIPYAVLIISTGVLEVILIFFGLWAGFRAKRGTLYYVLFLLALTTALFFITLFAVMNLSAQFASDMVFCSDEFPDRDMLFFLDGFCVSGRSEDELPKTYHDMPFGNTTADLTSATYWLFALGLFIAGCIIAIVANILLAGRFAWAFHRSNNITANEA